MFYGVCLVCLKNNATIFIKIFLGYILENKNDGFKRVERELIYYFLNSPS